MVQAKLYGPSLAIPVVWNDEAATIRVEGTDVYATTDTGMVCVCVCMCVCVCVCVCVSTDAGAHVSWLGNVHSKFCAWAPLPL